MKIFISGGCKNGKSSHAQRLAKRMRHDGPLYYVATMIARDAEDDARVAAHRQDRAGWGFETVEAPYDIRGALAACAPGGTFLLDSVTALLENAMFLPDGGVDTNAHIRLADELAGIVERFPNIVLVSDYIYSDAIAYADLTERYRQNLAYIDRRLAAACDVVLEGCCGLMIAHKGRALLAGHGYAV